MSDSESSVSSHCPPTSVSSYERFEEVATGDRPRGSADGPASRSGPRPHRSPRLSAALDPRRGGCRPARRPGRARRSHRGGPGAAVSDRSPLPWTSRGPAVLRHRLGLASHALLDIAPHRLLAAIRRSDPGSRTWITAARLCSGTWRPVRARSSRTCRSSARGRRASSGRPSSSCSSTSSLSSRSPSCRITCSTISAGRPRLRRCSCSWRCTGRGTTRRG